MDEEEKMGQCGRAGMDGDGGGNGDKLTTLPTPLNRVGKGEMLF